MNRFVWLACIAVSACAGTTNAGGDGAAGDTGSEVTSITACLFNTNGNGGVLFGSTWCEGGCDTDNCYYCGSQGMTTYYNSEFCPGPTTTITALDTGTPDADSDAGDGDSQEADAGD